MNKKKTMNFSILGITFTERKIKFQDKGIKKLSSRQKTQVKNYLTNIIENL